MAILISKDTRVITQGITGKAGQIHTRACLAYGNGRNCFVAGVHPRKGGTDFEGIPIYSSVKEAKERTGATTSVIYVPPNAAAAAIDEAVDAELDLVICITVGVPVQDMLRTLEKMQGRKTLLLGPNSPGLITHGEIKIGIMQAHDHKKGRIGVVSRSGVLSYEVESQLLAAGFFVSTCIGIGGDSVGGLKHIDVMRLFNDDPETDAVIVVGEIAADAEETCARWVKDHMKKPVVRYVAGDALSSDKKDVEEELALMQDCGIVLERDFSDIGALLRSVLYEDSFWMVG
jgi:succinyl-CoA synthetase alpha subunit